MFSYSFSGLRLFSNYICNAKYHAYSSSKLYCQFHLTSIPSFAWMFYFASYLMQDIDFFETEAVGDLTSRLGADCQQLSNIIGNDINMILRNFLQVFILINHSFLFLSSPSIWSLIYCSFQGAGALINLLTLSWPLALSTIVICSVLSAIFLVYGQ